MVKFCIYMWPITGFTHQNEHSSLNHRYSHKDGFFCPRLWFVEAFTCGGLLAKFKLSPPLPDCQSGQKRFHR